MFTVTSPRRRTAPHYQVAADPSLRRTRRGRSRYHRRCRPRSVVRAEARHKGDDRRAVVTIPAGSGHLRLQTAVRLAPKVRSDGLSNTCAAADAPARRAAAPESGGDARLRKSRRCTHSSPRNSSSRWPTVRPSKHPQVVDIPGIEHTGWLWPRDGRSQRGIRARWFPRDKQRTPRPQQRSPTTHRQGEKLCPP